ncbi:MAG: RNA 2',3'-cyclic phosphodiesterase [Deltaproteobacteria bacterium]|nr:RNA 2',3'-cyclic phosphodiesterase [Deltaproteobacteria bacterium]
MTTLVFEPRLEMLPDKIRAFVALRLSAEVECAIAEFAAPMRALRSGVRWVRPANLHLTLRFLGDTVDNNLLLLLGQALNQISGQTSPFMLHARGTGAFPNLDRPRIIWIGLVSEQLSQLAQHVEGAAVQVGFTPEGRPYTPHLTIGRVRDLHGWPRIRQMLRQSPNPDFGSVLISEMILYRSILGGEAAQYQPLTRYPLTGAR